MRRVYGTGRAVYCRRTRCGRGGARCFHNGLEHKTCLSPEERKDYEKALKASYTANVKHEAEAERR